MKQEDAKSREPFPRLIKEAAELGRPAPEAARLMVALSALDRYRQGAAHDREARASFRLAIEEIAGLLDQVDNTAAVGRMLALIGDLLGGFSTTAVSGRRQRKGKDVRYVRRDGRKGLELMEVRPGMTKPFRVKQRDYQAVLKALGDCGLKERASFKELHEAFVKHGGSNVKSGYPLRATLRFLQQTDPPLIDGIRDGYRANAGTKAKLKQDGERLFEQLPEAS